LGPAFAHGILDSHGQALQNLSTSVALLSDLAIARKDNLHSLNRAGDGSASETPPGWT
jgi:hypothetical protein